MQPVEYAEAMAILGNIGSLVEAARFYVKSHNVQLPRISFPKLPMKCSPAMSWNHSATDLRFPHRDKGEGSHETKTLAMSSAHFAVGAFGAAICLFV